ncbi:MAG: hypothetical protein K6A44_05400 [bacterium]|nr:hypothetical protein [bacterium]
MKSFLFKHLISRVYNLIFSVKSTPKPLGIKPEERCLILGGKTEDIFSAAGGTILLNSEKFSVCSLTNGFRQIIDKDLTYEEKVKIRKDEFEKITDKAQVSFGEFYEDVDEGRLIMRYDKFKSVIISDYDYIFLPNILEPDKDNKAVALLLNELIKERPYKRHAKIVFYEVSSTLPMVNGFVDIEEKVETKSELLDSINNNAETNFSQNVLSLNKFRGACVHKNYAEAFCVLGIDEFKDICRLYR